MLQRLFPTLAKLDAGSLLGIAISAVFVWVLIAASTERFFVSRGWITVVDSDVPVYIPGDGLWRVADDDNARGAVPGNPGGIGTAAAAAAKSH